MLAFVISNVAQNSKKLETKARQKLERKTIRLKCMSKTKNQTKIKTLLQFKKWLSNVTPMIRLRTISKQLRKNDWIKSVFLARSIPSIVLSTLWQLGSLEP
jgi:hypothetical protein